MMQHFGLEDLSHVHSRRSLLKYLVRVEMASDWFTRIYRSILAEQISSKIEIYGVQTRLQALLEPAIRVTHSRILVPDSRHSIGTLHPLSVLRA